MRHCCLILCAFAVVSFGVLTGCQTTKTVHIHETTVTRPAKAKAKADPGTSLEPVRKPATFSN